MLIKVMLTLILIAGLALFFVTAPNEKVKIVANLLVMLCLFFAIITSIAIVRIA